MAMQYGYFDDSAREYVITNPRTPVKWINYIGTLSFGGFVDHTGGALICKGDPSLNRIVKYIQQMPRRNSRVKLCMYESSVMVNIRFFSVFVPTLDKYDRYECHVGMGYSRIISVFYGVRTECTIFVPVNEQVEIRDIVITNISSEPQEIDVIPVIEYTHFDAVKQFTNADWVPQTMVSRCHTDQQNTRVLIQYPFMCRDFKVNYFTSNYRYPPLNPTGSAFWVKTSTEPGLILLHLTKMNWAIMRQTGVTTLQLCCIILE